jgi:hypothetical protein
MNAKRALESNEDEDEDSDGNANTNTNSRSSCRSQRPALKRRCETPRQQSEVIVKVESMDKGLSKDDWKEILAITSGGEELRKEVSSLQTTVHQMETTVNQIASSSERTNELLQRLLFPPPGGQS